MDFTPRFGMGSLPPKTDVRDYQVKAGVARIAELPEEYSVEPCMKIKDQGCVSSCVAHATSTILEFHDGAKDTLSTNFIYGGQRAICEREGAGMYLRDACKIVKDYGNPLESQCRGNDEVPDCYDIAEKALSDTEVMETAKMYKINSYASVYTDADIKYAIMNYGPVLASVKWFYDTYVDDNNVMQTSHKGDYGYHAIVLYGWNKKGFLMQNSWGRSWGNKGRAILPYTYGINECRAIVDADNEDIVVPTRNRLLDIVYKIINFLCNLFPKK